ncbi:hypothetical protein K2173_023044 [Erythroxylum novogranatense]|uniref:Uncharacterized protein n=1 Tax=Erythroxylum novogranatense TaxID=1862640 RepID=A0AAV8T9P1_9ROSI|nr:hypothetical protein K2173_023044 [Erythroxylum novogranatense]
MLDPGTKFPDSHVQFWDQTGRLSGKYGDTKFGVRPPKAAENYARYKVEDDDKSGVYSSPLWRTSPHRSPHHRQVHYQSMSPSSRTQAIARGQRELMEMVSRMPEGCYELSLKDIVEHPMVQVEEEKEGEDVRRRSEKGKRTSTRKAQINRSQSIDNGGFLLKMVFPISCGSRSKKKKNPAMNDGRKDGRVSPRPLFLDGQAKGIDHEEWWKKRHSESAESDQSGGFSSNTESSKSSASSRSSSRSSSRAASGACCSFIFTNKGKRAG